MLHSYNSITLHQEKHARSSHILKCFRPQELNQMHEMPVQCHCLSLFLYCILSVKIGCLSLFPCCILSVKTAKYTISILDKMHCISQNQTKAFLKMFKATLPSQRQDGRWNTKWTWGRKILKQASRKMLFFISQGKADKEWNIKKKLQCILIMHFLWVPKEK